MANDVHQQETAALLAQIRQQPHPLAPQGPAAGNVEAEVAGRVHAFRLPPGAADVTSFQDFASLVLAVESPYSIPLNTQTSACAPLVEQSFHQALQTLRADSLARGFSVDALDELRNVVNLSAKEQTKLRKCLLKRGDVVSQDKEMVNTGLLRDIGEDIDGLVDVNGYPFDIFQPRTINLGLRLVYRQEWTPLWYQVGELLQTIPLAPGEKIRYETKTWHTSKTVEEHNESTTYSTEDVRSTTRRDIREILKQTTTAFGVKVEASGAANIGPAQVGGSAASSADHKRESRRSKQKFQEFMRKSTEALRNERRVAVSVTREEGAEGRITRDLVNPNDEITVTYLFYELQRVYQVRQYLYNVEPVVYVAMDVPAAREIDEEWVIAHDWILAGAALDKSFIDPISFISQELPGLREARNAAQAIYDQALAVVQEIQGNVSATESEISEATGLADIILQVQLKSLTGKLKAATDSLHKAEEKLRAAETAYQQGVRKRDRLLEHIRQNILHYMQAIWAAEVPEQRYLRLRSIPYPHVTRQDDGSIQSTWLPLADVIDTNHPLGYLGNYVVFQLTRDDNAIVIDLAKNYISEDGLPADPDAEDPDETSIRIVTPADAVYIEALPGQHALLEPFKLQHRMLDVERARQEVIALQLENMRRLMLIHNNQLGDPKLDKVFIADSQAMGRLVSGLGQ